MASGIVTLTRNSTGVYLLGQIVWSSVSNGSEANTSTVTATLQLQRYALNTTTGTFKGTFTVGGTSETISWYGSLPSKTWVTIKTITVTVNHNASGVGSCYLYAKINGPGSTTMEGTYVSGSSTVTLDTIPREAKLDSVSAFSDATNPEISYNNPLGGAVPSLQVGLSLTQSYANVITYHNVDRYSSKDTIELTSSELNTLYAATTGGNTRTVWVCLRTRIGETYYYSWKSTIFTITNPNPTISPTIIDTNGTTTALTGNSSKLVRYYSNAKITIGAAAAKGASLVSKKVTCGSKSLTADGTISAIESGNFVFTATDNRGNSKTETITPSFVNYVKLTCNISNNTPATDGTMTVKTTGNYFDGSFGSESNSLNVYYRYKVYGTAWPSDGGWKAMTVTKSGNSYSATANLTGLDYLTTYVFQTYAKDALATVYSAERTAKSIPVFDWGETDFNFNVPVDIKESLTVSGDISVDGSYGQIAADGLQFNTVTVTVGGDANTYYPVWVNTYNNSATPQYLFLKKELVQDGTDPSWDGNHGSYGSSSVMMGWMYRANGWDGNGSFCQTLYKHEPYASLVAHLDILSSGASRGSVLYLRGGGTNYYLASNLPFIATVYLQNANISLNSSYTVTVTPKTSVDNGGVYNQNIPLDTNRLLNFFYPVNSIYISYSHISPASLFGGTWHRIESRFLWGTPSTGTIGATAGEQTHVLTSSEMPSHRHDGLFYSGNNQTITLNKGSTGYTLTYGSNGGKGVDEIYTGTTGGGAAHNNMPPYVNVAIWRRTA